MCGVQNGGAYYSIWKKYMNEKKAGQQNKYMMKCNHIQCM